MTRGRAGLLAVFALGCACIIPDSQINVQPNRTNPGTVRVVQAVALSAQANEACAEEPGFLACPMPPNTVAPGLIEEEDQAFCVCAGGRDGNALGGFDIYVEDPDVDDDGEPKDTLLGAFLLDVVPGDEPVSQFVAYTNYFPTNRPAQRFPTENYDQPIERPPTNLKSWVLGSDTTLDLCNNNNGNALEPGVHGLRLVVTDRPWALPLELDEDGLPIKDGEDFARLEGADPLVGVPDTPAGASYDIADFVFRCVDETTEEGANVCNCEEEVEG